MDSPPPPIDKPTVTFAERHARDLPQLKAIGHETAVIAKRLGIRELKARGKKSAVPLLKVMFDTGGSILRELLTPTNDDESEDDDEAH